MVSAKALVVTVALTADRGTRCRLGQSLAVADRDVLGAAIRVWWMSERRVRSIWRSQRASRARRVGVPFCMGAADPPARDAAREDVDDEGHIDPALPGRDVVVKSDTQSWLGRSA